MKKLPTIRIDNKILATGLAGFVIVMLAVTYGLIPAGEENRRVGTASGRGIDSLMTDLGKLQEREVFKETISGLPGTGGSMDREAVMEEIRKKTTEELKAELLSTATESDKKDFVHELETVFDTGEERGFFVRQISYCRTRLDLAVVGLGILRVHEVLRGENRAVAEKDRAEFIGFVRDQVQDAVASGDRNYKAVVFHGLESSIH